MLIYLDTNVYCRPMDAQTRKRIRNETEAFFKIQVVAHRKEVEFLGSDILRYEITRIENAHKREEANRYIVLCHFFVEEHEAIRALAEDLARTCKLDSRDALHLAAAIIGKAEHFLTCDADVAKKAKCVNTLLKKLNQKIIIENPVTFLQTFKGG